MLAALGLVVALVAASAATGHSQSAPVNTKEPFISAPFSINVGTTIQGHKGDWTGTAPISYGFQWRRCNGNAQNCSNIAGANSTSYTVVSADRGHTLRFRVTAQNADGKTQAVSNATQEVPEGANAPSLAALPTISGVAVVGEKLQATSGTWNGSKPITYTYHWATCNQQGTGCVANGGNSQTYTVASSDKDHRLRVQVVAKNSAGQTAAVSDATAVVKAQGGGGPPGTAISVNDVGPAGDRLVVDQVTFTPNPVSSRGQPITVRIRIKNTKGQLVRGALVSIQSTPVVASIPTPAPTGEDGGITYTIHPESDFPLKNGYSVQFFVKAYRQGDPTLAGISGTRLVQVKTKAP